jgi:hypothetical protein
MTYTNEAQTETVVIQPHKGLFKAIYTRHDGKVQTISDIAEFKAVEWAKQVLHLEKIGKRKVGRPMGLSSDRKESRSISIRPQIYDKAQQLFGSVGNAVEWAVAVKTDMLNCIKRD